jgi:hypothetical protein
VGAAGNTVIEAVIASDQTFYIMPIFGPGPETDTDTVTVDGREWAQLDQFTDLSWSDINAACPAGVCSGVLNGYNMTGWTWASVDDVDALFAHFIGNVDRDDRFSDPVPIDCFGFHHLFWNGFRSTLDIIGWHLDLIGYVVDLRDTPIGGFSIERYDRASGCFLITGEREEQPLRPGGFFWRR